MSSWRLPVGAAIIVHVAIIAIPVLDPAATPAPAVVHLRLAAAATPTPQPAPTPTPTAAVAAPQPIAEARRPVRAAPPELTREVAPSPPPRAPSPPPTSAVASAPTSALPAELTAAPPTAPAPPRPVDLAAYAARVRDKVASHKRYPRRAQRMGISGVATIAVTIDSSGKLSAPPRLATSSGSDLLDREALRMTSAAARFPAPPSGTRVDIEIPVRFSLP